jgi:hypothetical protein
MSSHDANLIFGLLFWAAVYLIPIMGRRSKNLPWAAVWMRFKKFIPVCVGLAVIATILGGLMSGTVGAVGSLVGSLLSTTWLFLTYVVHKVEN